MNTVTKETITAQLIKKQRLDREFAWISREFKDFHTLADVDIYNTERYAALQLGYVFKKCVSKPPTRTPCARP